MKRLSWLVVVLVLTVVLSGCAIYMNPTYSNLLDKTTAWSVEVSSRAEAGKLTEEEKTEALKANAGLWEKFRNAKDGVK